MKLSVVLDECRVKSRKMVAAISPNNEEQSLRLELKLVCMMRFGKMSILTVSHSSNSCFVPIPGSVLCHLSMT